MNNFERYHFLKSLGSERLGTGTTSEVYSCPWDDKKVIKLGARDDGWLAYCAWAAEHGYAGKFAPTVYAWKADNSGVYCAMTERLHIGSGEPDRYRQDNLDQLTNRAYQLAYPTPIDRYVNINLSPEYEAFMQALRRDEWIAPGRFDVGYSNVMWRRSNRMWVVNDPMVWHGQNGTIASRYSMRRSRGFTQWSDPIV